MNSNENFYFDISHYYTFRHDIKVLFNVIKKDGISGFLKRTKKHLYFKYKDVDFSPENIFELSVKGKNRQNGSTYHAVLEKPFEEILEEIKKRDPSVTNGAFLDYGSGKGFSLYMASKFGFAKVIGVEFAKKLADISKKNLKNLNVKNAKIYHEDASEFIPPSDIRVIFLYNPFNEEVMQKVLDQIMKVKDTFLGDLYIAYHYPICNKVFEKEKDIIFLQEIFCSFSNETTYLYKIPV